MTQRNSLPQTQGMLHRPRVQALIHKGLQYPLLVMLAGPGYGKTQAVTSYLSDCDGDVLWLRLGSLDNLPAHFWNHLIQTLRHKYPALSESLQDQEFPDTLSGIDMFIQLLKREIREETIWVFDDFGEIADSRIRNFFRLMAEAELENFHLVLISNVLSSTESIAFMTNKQFLVLGKDLRFTREEISELYNAHDMPLEESELDEIENHTEGWPLPLYLLVLQKNKKPALVSRDGKLTHQLISHVFEERFFAAYPTQKQKLLVGLSLLSSFTRGLADELYDGDPADLEALENHVFIAREPATDRFVWHHLYRAFLQKKKSLLNAKEERRVLRKAAEYYSLSGYAMEAIDCYRRCGDHKNMLDVMSGFVRFQYGTNSADAAHLLEYIDLLTPEEARKYPIADYLRALIYLNTLELEKSEALLTNLEQRLSGDDSPDARSLLGETYALSGALRLMNSREDFGDCYRRAADYLLPEGSFLHNKNKLLIRNYHTFSMPDTLPGARERMERAIHYGTSWMSQVLCGDMNGMEHLFSAEAAYFSYRISDAQQHAWRAIYKAEINAQHCIVCNGYCLLARIGLVQGDFEEMSRQIQNVVDYAEKYDFGVLKEIRDTALGWYYIKLRDFKRIPKNVLATNDRSDNPLLEQGRLKILYACYLINAGEYAKVVGMLEYPMGLHLTRSVWVDRIYLCILLALGHHYLGNSDVAMKALRTAYDMSYHNGLTTLFIEMGSHMCALVDAARQQRAFKFAPGWLDTVSREAARYAKRITTVHAAYKKQNPVKEAKNNPLTKREVDVLRALSQGLTREEIAVKQFVSINTVKSFIRNIYNKLGAMNRTEAISIAISNGYIEFPASEWYQA